MEAKLGESYWKAEEFWVGKLLEHPEIMPQGETTLKFLVDNRTQDHIHTEPPKLPFPP